MDSAGETSNGDLSGALQASAARATPEKRIIFFVKLINLKLK
jgi:hypothetical protein